MKSFFWKKLWIFFDKVDEKAKDKIIYNIEKAKYTNDPKLLKKLDNEIWEFRTKYQKLNYRIFAFWDKAGNIDKLVVATHGIIKKTSKVSKKDMDKARAIMEKYFERKNKRD